MVDAIVLKAKDAEGNKIFKLDDKKVLMNSADPEVIVKVAEQVLNTTPLDEIEKK
jgi:hypothetical protein